MERIHDAVEAYLANRRWPYEDHGRQFVSLVVGQTGRWTAYFDLEEEDEQLAIYSLLPVRIAEDRRTEVALFLTRANSEITIGNFELDLDTGAVRYKTSVDVEGVVLEDPLIDHLLLANVVTVDRYLDALRAFSDVTVAEPGPTPDVEIDN